MKDNLKIPYGVADFKRVRNEKYYYIDKTGYIPLLEQAGSFLFLVRPRRFGKSLMASMLRCYYDVAETDNFDSLFGGLEIAKNPTENKNRYQVLYMDFSEVNKGRGKTLKDRFENYVEDSLVDFFARYGSKYPEDIHAEFPEADVASKFNMIVKRARLLGFPLYLMLDEYDNFTIQMLRAEGGEPYRSVTHGEGFYREWFKSFKAAFDRIYMTGVSPVTMDDLTSGFNIATNISQDPDFNSMLGFSEEEVLRLYADFKGTGAYTDGDPAEWVASCKPWYDGYCFSEEKIGTESVFNSDMALYHLSALVKFGRPPKNMVDRNIATDYDKLQMIADIQHAQFRARFGSDADDTGIVEDVLPLTEQLAATGQISFDLVDSFPADKIADEENFRSLFYYYGILSMGGREKGTTVFKIPNACVERQLFGYLRDAYHVGRRPRRPEMELSRGFCDFALFPERTYFGDVGHSYLVELKISKADAPDSELAAKYAEAIEQLAKYRADPFVPSLARGTVLHQIVYQFKGDDPIRIEQIAEEAM